MLRVGGEGDIGVVELQDLMFTSEGPTAGVVLMEWNVAQDEQGSAAMWGAYHLKQSVYSRRWQAS